MFGGVLLQNNFQREWKLRREWNCRKRREGGKSYYLVVAAVGPNYSYAFVSLLKLFFFFEIRIAHFTSHPRHTSCHTYIANQLAWNKCSTAPVLITAVFLSPWHLISFQRLLSAKHRVTISQCRFLVFFLKKCYFKFNNNQFCSVDVNDSYANTFK